MIIEPAPMQAEAWGLSVYVEVKTMPHLVNDITDRLPRNAKRKPAIRKHSKISYWAVHHMGTGKASTPPSPDSVARYHIGPNHISKRGCPTVCYALMVDRQGNIYKTAQFCEVTWHVNALYNKRSLGILLLDDLDTNEPTPEMLEALEWLVVEWLPLQLPPVPYTHIKGHKEFPLVRKSCPGKNMDLPMRRLRIKYLLKYGK